MPGQGTKTKFVFLIFDHNITSQRQKKGKLESEELGEPGGVRGSGAGVGLSVEQNKHGGLRCPHGHMEGTGAPWAWVGWGKARAELGSMWLMFKPKGMDGISGEGEAAPRPHWGNPAFRHP